MSLSFAFDIALLLSLPLAAGAERIHDFERHWSVESPSGWIAGNPDIVEAIDAESADRQPRRNFRFLRAFTKDPSGVLTCPYIVVQQTDVSLSGHTYEEIAKGLGAADTKSAVQGVSDRWPNVLKDFDAGVIRLDRAHNRMLFRVSAETVQGARVQAISFGYLGREAIIQFNCYATPDTFDALLPEFESIVSTFAFDPGYELIVATESDRTRQGAIRAMIGGAVAGGASVVLLVVYGLLKKARSRTEASR